MLNDGKDMQSAPSAGVQQAAPVALPFAVLDALRFYANGLHFNINDRDAWDTVSGEPQNYWCDEAGTSTVEDGSIAKAALQGVAFTDGEDADPIDGEVYTAAPAPSASPAVPQPSAKALTDAKDWLLDVMGEWDFTIPAGAFDKIVALLAAEQPSEDMRAASEAGARESAYVRIGRPLLNQVTADLKIFTGHDSGANLRAVYGEHWWERLHALREALDAAITKGASA